MARDERSRATVDPYGRIPRRHVADVPEGQQAWDPLTFAVLAYLCAKARDVESTFFLRRKSGSSSRIVVPANCVAVSQRYLAGFFGVSRKRIRTSLRFLHKTGEIGPTNMDETGPQIMIVRVAVGGQLELPTGAGGAHKYRRKGPAKGPQRAHKGPDSREYESLDSETSVSSDTERSAPPGSNGSGPSLRSWVFDQGEAVLGSRAAAGTLLKAVRDDEGEAAKLLNDAVRQADPRSWLWAAIHHRGKRTGSGERELTPAEYDKVQNPVQPYYLDADKEWLRRRGLWDDRRGEPVGWALRQVFKGR